MARAATAAAAVHSRCWVAARPWTRRLVHHHAGFACPAPVRARPARHRPGTPAERVARQAQRDRLRVESRPPARARPASDPVRARRHADPRRSAGDVVGTPAAAWLLRSRDTSTCSKVVNTVATARPWPPGPSGLVELSSAGRGRTLAPAPSRPEPTNSPCTTDRTRRALLQATAQAAPAGLAASGSATGARTRRRHAAPARPGTCPGDRRAGADATRWRGSCR